MISEIKFKDSNPDRVGVNGIKEIRMHVRMNAFLIIGEKSVVYKPTYTVEYVVGSDPKDFEL